MTKEKTYVIAGNYFQFIDYLKDKQNQVYVVDRLILMGIRKPKVLLIGTYYERDDWYALELELHVAEAQIIKEPANDDQK